MCTTLTIKFPLLIIQRLVIYNLVYFKTQKIHFLEARSGVILVLLGRMVSCKLKWTNIIQRLRNKHLGLLLMRDDSVHASRILKI